MAYSETGLAWRAALAISPVFAAGWGQAAHAARTLTPVLAYHGSEGARQVKMIAVPRAVLQLQYEAVRLPIVVLDAWVLGRYLAEESRLRLSFERALASCDTAAGWLLDDRTLRQRAALRQRTALPRAAQLECDGSHRRGQAEQQPTTAPRLTGRRARAQRDHLDDVVEAWGDEEAGRCRVAEQADARGKTEKDWAETAARGGAAWK